MNHFKRSPRINWKCSLITFYICIKSQYKVSSSLLFLPIISLSYVGKVVVYLFCGGGVWFFGFFFFPFLKYGGKHNDVLDLLRYYSRKSGKEMALAKDETVKLYKEGEVSDSSGLWGIKTLKITWYHRICVSLLSGKVVCMKIIFSRGISES